jgi:hypothetical protein
MCINFCQSSNTILIETKLRLKYLSILENYEINFRAERKNEIQVHKGTSSVAAENNGTNQSWSVYTAIQVFDQKVASSPEDTNGECMQCRSYVLPLG